MVKIKLLKNLVAWQHFGYSQDEIIKTYVTFQADAVRKNWIACALEMRSSNGRERP